MFILPQLRLWNITGVDITIIITTITALRPQTLIPDTPAEKTSTLPAPPIPPLRIDSTTCVEV